MGINYGHHLSKKERLMRGCSVAIIPLLNICLIIFVCLLFVAYALIKGGL